MYVRVFKRLLDLLIAVPALIILSPLILIVVLLAWALQGWPVIFTQERAGYKGRKFKILKFRSMTNTRDANGRLLPDKDRTGRFGHLLRSSSLDELPGLINVIKGEMSIIGPRALHYSYLEYYTPAEQTRHDVRPGVVGLAGVRGRNTNTWESAFSHDIFYVQNCSLALDLKIFYETFAVVLKREGIESTRPPFDEYRRKQLAQGDHRA